MKSRILLYGFLVLLLPVLTNAQILNPVHWNYTVEKVNDSIYNLHMKASIDQGWHVYSQDAGEGPIPTSFTFEDNAQAELIGEVEEKGKEVKTFDKVFNSELRYYENEVDFVQKVKVKGSTTLKGKLEFMVCNDVNCLPPKEVPFSFTLTSNVPGATVVGNAAGTPQQPISTKTPDSSSKDLALTSGNDDTNHSEKSLWSIFILGLITGLGALIMPCIYAMIPVTVSYFTKRSETRAQGIRNATYYSLSIIIIFTLLGFLGTIFFGPRSMNEFSSSAGFNIFVFLIFMLFGLSFLGAFEITLPGSWSNKLDSKAGLGSFTGIFFMALTLVVVSFSCTAPFIGYLVVWTSKGGMLGPVIGFFGFSLALAIPFAFFAVFPGLLNNIAKSGGWLNTVKVVLGFVELALALKFLSSADLAYHWHLLDREVYLSLWIVIFGLLGLYLLGKIKLPHDSDLSHLSVVRLMSAIIALSFTVYMIPGLWGAPLNAISAWLPETTTQDFNLYKLQVNGIANAGASTGNNGSNIKPQKYTDFLGSEIPGVVTFFDYEEAMDAARKEKKPLMIDFTGHACANCRKMESEVLSNADIRKILQDDFIVVSLYVDEKTNLPEDEQYVSKLDGGRVKTIGAKNLDFEAKLINSNAQPNYVFVDQNGKILTNAGGYNPNIERFKTLLKEAIQKYKQENP